MKTLDISDSRRQLLSIKDGGLVPPNGCVQQRYVLAFLACLGSVCSYTCRVNMSVAIVSMVNQTAVQERNIVNISDECQWPVEENGTALADGEFVWTQSTQGTILGSFFWGYIVTQVPGGWLAQRWSGKWVYGVGIFVTGLLTLVTPIAAWTSVGWLLFVRFLQGCAQGLIFPSLQVTITKWAPPLERTQMATVALVGIQIGSFVALSVTGLICGSEWTGGWPSSFYFFGILTSMWFMFWALFAADAPGESRWITVEEKIYIQKSVGKTASFQEGEERQTPWVDIFTSLPLWAILVAHMANNWGFFMVLTCLPQYMNDVLHFGIMQNGFFSALPYLAFVIFGIPMSFVADMCRRRQWLSTTAVRKICNLLAMILPGSFLLAAGFVGCDRALAVLCVILSVTFASFSLGSVNVNHMDLAPRFVGVLMGITNSAATVSGIVAPYMVGELTNAQPTRGQWQIVFYITFGIYAFAAIFYSVFGSGVKQRWNDHGPRTERLKQRFTSIKYGSIPDDDDMTRTDR